MFLSVNPVAFAERKIDSGLSALIIALWLCLPGPKEI